jgi:hypothetical protein
VDDHRKEHELFPCWAAERLYDEDSVEAPYVSIGQDEIEACVVYLRDECGAAYSSRKNPFAVLRSFFKTVAKRMKPLDPIDDLHEVHFHHSHVVQQRHLLVLGCARRRPSLFRPTAARWPPKARPDHDRLHARAFMPGALSISQ